MPVFFDLRTQSALIPRQKENRHSVRSTVPVRFYDEYFSSTLQTTVRGLCGLVLGVPPAHHRERRAEPQERPLPSD